MEDVYHLSIQGTVVKLWLITDEQNKKALGLTESNLQHSQSDEMRLVVYEKRPIARETKLTARNKTKSN